MEEPKAIPGFPDYLIDKTGTAYSIKTGKIKLKKSYSTGVGYVGTKLTSPDGKLVSKLIHRLVWETFMGPIPDGFEINHKDGAKKNNELSNLELNTRSQNQCHARDMLNVKGNFGEKNGKAKLTKEGVKRIKELRDLGWSHKRIAEAFGVSQPTITNVLKGKHWAKE